MRCSSAADSTRSLIARREFVSGIIFVISCALLMSTSIPFTDALQRLVQHRLGIKSDQLLISTFTLNLALLLFSWRRYRDLRHMEQVQAENDLAAEQANAIGLPGMVDFERQTRLLIEHCARNNAGEVVLLTLDVDHHGLVTDVHGRETADMLLCQVAKSLREIAPPDAIISHAGADEFAIAFACPASNQQQLVATVRHLSQNIDWTFNLADRQLHTTCSMGAVSTLGETLDYPELWRRGQMAMRFAMRRGHGHCIWFGSDMDIELRSRSAVEDAIRIGIPANEFQPYFERQVDLATGRLVGFEVLARWKHDIFSSVPTERFINVAEKSGQIADLSKAIFRTALLEARHWNPEITLSINISPIQMEDPWLAEKLLQLLVETGFPANRLEVEITENALIDDFDLARTILTNLKNQGISLAVDDFGIGYSSLQLLRSLPFDRIKIDKSFIQTIDQSSKSFAIASSIVSLADNLGLPATAEGIETPEIMAKLVELGCQKGQGWYFGRPMPAEEARKIARRPIQLVSGGADRPRQQARHAL